MQTDLNFWCIFVIWKKFFGKKEKYQQILCTSSDRWRPKLLYILCPAYCPVLRKMIIEMKPVHHQLFIGFSFFFFLNHFFPANVFINSYALLIARVKISCLLVLGHKSWLKPRSLAVCFFYKHALVSCKSDAGKWLTFTFVRQI